ncbi:hypothetical protein RFI_31943, partial [Reticulomyxa filosa]
KKKKKKQPNHKKKKKNYLGNDRPGTLNYKDNAKLEQMQKEMEGLKLEMKRVVDSKLLLVEFFSLCIFVFCFDTCVFLSDFLCRQIIQDFVKMAKKQGIVLTEKWDNLLQ